MPLFSTGPIENKPSADGVRETVQIVVRIVNNSTNYGTVQIEGYTLIGVRVLYANESFSIGPNESISKEYFANLDGYEFSIETNGDAADNIQVSVWGKNSDDLLIAAHRLVNEESAQPSGSTPYHPVFTQSVSTAETPNVVLQATSDAAKQGRYFRVTSNDQQLFGNGFLFLSLFNPPENINSLFIERISGGTSQNTVLSTYFQGNLIEPGELVTPLNQLIGFERKSNAIVEFGLSLTFPITGGLVNNSFPQSGLSQILVIDYEGRIILPPGARFTAIIENRSGGVNLGSMNIGYSEYPLIPFPTV